MSLSPSGLDQSSSDPAGPGRGQNFCQMVRVLLGVPYCGLWRSESGVWREVARSAHEDFSAVPRSEALEQAQLLGQAVDIPDCRLDPTASKWAGGDTVDSLRYVFATTLSAERCNAVLWGVLAHDVIPRNLGASRTGMLDELCHWVDFCKIVKME